MIKLINAFQLLTNNFIQITSWGDILLPSSFKLKDRLFYGWVVVVTFLILETNIAMIITCRMRTNKVMLSMPRKNWINSKNTIKSSQLLFKCCILFLLKENSTNTLPINIARIAINEVYSILVILFYRIIENGVIFYNSN